MKRIPLTPTQERGLDRLNRRESIGLARLMLRAIWFDLTGRKALAGYWRIVVLDRLEKRGAAEPAD